MLPTLCWLIFLTGALPLWQAWRANWQTSLYQAVGGALIAWLAWSVALFPGVDSRLVSYLALALTACAGLAVPGARRPGVRAWGFVLLGLLAVLLLPVAEGLGTVRLSWPNLVFLAGILTFVVLNYLPTRLAPAALFLATGCALELVSVVLPAEESEPGRLIGRWLLALTPWVAWIQMASRTRPLSEFDRIWLDFRDRFGFLWAQRVREQFNRSAANAGWPVHLYWQGLRLKAGTALPGDEVQTAIVATLRALLKRFGPETEK